MPHTFRLASAGLVLVAFGSFAGPGVQAQSPPTGSVEGVVLEGGFNTPLAGVNVVVPGTRHGTSTDPDGRFRLGRLPAGTHTLRATSVGYAAATQEVVVEPGEPVRVTLTLREQPVELTEARVEAVMLTGGLAGLADVPGSAHYITPRELETFGYTDIHRVLSEVPGVNVQEEDGYGLRPNIGLRGTGTERSSKITVMEDGVLMAPAPYSAPSAYYFPTVGRMQGVEVRKGSSQIKYGPYTTGGALNLISAQIPTHFQAMGEVLGGGHGERTLHARVGASQERYGALLETYQAQADGFKELDTGGSTGFDKGDVIAKLRLSTRADARVYQALTLKLGWTDETSDETYLGLTDSDFAITPFRRYAASQEDVMNTEHRQAVLRHVLRPSERVDVTTTLYRTTFSRNWYKLDKVRAGGDAVSISSLLADPDAFAAEYAILTGATSPTASALDVKANNRSYLSRGVQSELAVRLETGQIEHQLEVGLRYHEDEVDRFQWVDAYAMADGAMTLTQAGTPGTESNRVEAAEAWAAFAQWRLKAGAVTALPGLRYERITLDRLDYGKADPERTGVDASFRENRVGVLIPGIGLNVDLGAHVSVFGGVHRGFAPPGSQDETEPESSTNVELGGRYLDGTLRGEAVVYANDYRNLLGADLAAVGGTGQGSLFNGGEALVRGLELSVDHNLGVLAGWALSLPISLAYTFTDAQFENAFESDFDPWGTVEVGDELPYLPRHQLAAGAGVEGAAWGLHLNGRYVGAMRTEAGQGALQPRRSIDSHVVLDLAAEYVVQGRLTIFGSARNLTDEVYVVARRPAGLRPGLPRTLLLGLRVDV